MVQKTLISKVFVSAVLAAAFATASAAEPVATVSQVRGVALVSRGADYVTAKQGMTLSEGDRVMAMEGGSVALTYVDGCKLDIGDNQVFTVGNAASCSEGTLSQRSVGPYLAAAGTSDATTAGLIAAGVLGTVVIIGLASNSGSDDGATWIPQTPAPISP